MKSFKKLRGALRHDKKLHHHHHHHHRLAKSRTQLDELEQASQDMRDMRDCYDRLLSAAAATANSVYEFSESLGEMGDCLLEKNSLTDDEESGKVLLMLGKGQLELQKLVDGYRSHISQTITIPSESLLNELRIVEEMKRRCDEKRGIYEDLAKQSRDKGRLRSSKAECFSSQQLEVAQEEYDEEANTFVFRMKSLKQGQSRSLLTQAARHHAAQLSFLRKACKSLESIEPHVKLVAEEQHIDYQFRGLEDDGNEDYDEDDDEEDDDDSDSESSDDSELSFDQGQTNQGEDVSATNTSMELDKVDVTFPHAATVNAAKEYSNTSPISNSIPYRKDIMSGSKSGPLQSERKFDPSQMRHSPSQKFSTYVLPTPQEAKLKADTEAPQARRASLSSIPVHLYHSSPLLQTKYEKTATQYSGPIRSNTQSVLKESNSNFKSSRTAPPTKEPQIDSKKAKKAFSGPLTGKPWPNKISTSTSGRIAMNGYNSGPLLRTPIPPPPSSRVSPPKFVSSPKISELHELPRPPAHLSRPPNRVIHSGPLISRGQDFSAPDRFVMRTPASTLPIPPNVISRSYSIPSSGSKRLDTPSPMKIDEVLPSPPLTPIALTKAEAVSPGS